MDLTAIEKELKTAEISIEQELTDTASENTLQLWTGAKEVKLVSIETFVTEKGVKYFRLFFMDSAGVPMPSQFADQLGNIAIRADQFMNNFIPSMKFIHTMPSTTSPIGVIKALESETHKFYFVTKSSLKAWGMSLFTVIDYKATSELVRGAGL